MPRASINLEFEDGELRKFVEDGLRRWTLNTIHDVLKHIRDPNAASLIMQLFQTAIAAGSQVGKRGRPSQYEEDSGFERGGPPPHQQGRSPSPGPGIAEEILRGPPGASGRAERCMPVEANLYQERGWGCHKCSIYNGEQRSACRQCGHERCDDVVFGADDDGRPGSGGAAPPSGSA
ncbi:hypothetical protein LCGC14_2962280 [marine sediment metagenome]|uniref:RanBP2-type domain-containing protein n=1 Tax=marine sediment metagenome TaxID=412755 RepID=A0A0F8ZJN3_9ZZZZ